jgi:hypothetical protein
VIVPPFTYAGRDGADCHDRARKMKNIVKHPVTVTSGKHCRNDWCFIGVWA